MAVVLERPYFVIFAALELIAANFFIIFKSYLKYKIMGDTVVCTTDATKIS